jgi:hypothetical protein
VTAIVGVHGVGNHVPDQLADQVARQRSTTWAQHLSAGLGRPVDTLDVTMAYYAPLLHDGLPTSQGITDPDLALNHLDRQTAELVEAWLDALELPQVTVQGRLTVPLRQAVAVAAHRFSLNGRMTKLFVAACFPEVARYLAGIDAPARIAAREHVAATIRDHGARIVIAHSLGTVVTYEALHAHPDLQLDLLITLGSPLALPHGVFHRLQPGPDGQIGRRPSNLAQWVNISDRGDPVAILRPFKRFFPVDLDLTESVGLFDFHSAAKYLRCASVADTLQPHLMR